MAPADRKPSAALVEQLVEHPDWFDFVQAVRLLDQMALRGARQGRQSAQAVGLDHAPLREMVRFRAFPSLAFPGSPIVSLSDLVADPNSDWTAPAEMVVSFMGLTGPSGVLPQYYTSLLLDQIRDGETALRDFFDLFNHRLISLFYRASTKYRPTLIVSESRVHQRREDDLFTCVVRSLTGFGTSGHTQRFSFCDDLILFFAGHFAHAPRNAAALELMIVSFLRMPAVVWQFHGQWLYLNEEDQSCLPGRKERNGVANQLGVGVIVGERVWSVQSKFRVRIGPVGYAQFRRLMPVGDLLRPLCQFTRSYTGPEFDFDVQVILKAREVPACQLLPEAETRLGWNTWLFCGDFSHDAEDVVFQLPSV